VKLAVHLTFAGHCADAFRFYQRVLGGTDLRTFRWGDAPGSSDMPADWLVHASLTLGGYELMGADVATAQYERPRGFYVYHAVATRADAERIFAALSDGGSVVMPLSQTFWSPCFGVLVDRYGVPWEITATAA
jgi:PhnB protein